MLDTILKDPRNSIDPETLLIIEDMSEADALAYILSDENSSLHVADYVNMHNDLVEALELAHKFLQSLPEGWLGKTRGDVRSLNDFYIKSRPLLAKLKGR